MSGLSVDVNIDPDEDLFGKTVSDLQENIRIRDDHIVGKLHYIEDYSSAFSGDMAHGNYIVIHASVPGVDGVTIQAGLDNMSTLDEDGIIVCYVADKKSQTIKVVATKDEDTFTREFRLNDLTVEKE